ncbi:MAG TPA: DoxX family protein [Mariniphaga sp.]|nr:DoxX family protein [Mariniphaga sp.]
MKQKQTNFQLNHFQQWGLIILRIAIGWHFLYEGIVKITDPTWSAESYLINTRGALSGLFHRMASDPQILEFVNILNMWGLALIGISLFLGLFARTAVFSGILLLSFYYIAYPPFQQFQFGMPQEGSYLFVNKTLIEIAALFLLALFPSTLKIGLYSLAKAINIRIPKLKLFKEKQTVTAQPVEMKGNRREALKHIAFLPLLGSFGWAYACNKGISAPDGLTGSTIKVNQRSLSEIDGKMPMGVLAKGKQPISRLIMGTNHLSGNAHARDLKYASSLFKAYNTEQKIIETYMLAEKAGINLFFSTPLLDQYKKIYGGNFQTWTNVAPTKKDPYTVVDKAIDKGVEYIFVQGAACDRRVHDGETDAVLKCLDYIKQQGYPAGLGAHTIQAMLKCVEAGADPDFYYKTMHHDNYWSAHPKENREPYLWSANISPDHNKFHDNMWCLFPEETVEFIQKVRKPVVGFKVLAGGAILPEDGFQWAFDNGADFIEVGMFDFQIVGNVIQTIESVNKAQNRQRPWC